MPLSQTAGSEEVWAFFLRIIVRNQYLLSAPPPKERLHALRSGFTPPPFLFCYHVMFWPRAAATLLKSK